jgi:Fe-S-cluster containining protein
MVTSYKIVSLLAKKHASENQQFRNYLGIFHATAINHFASSLYQEIAPQIDCTSCGNCCRNLMVQLTDKDIERLAARMGQTPEAFINQYVEAGTRQSLFNAIPCPFLTENSCAVYDDRPASCRSFPELGTDQVANHLYALLMHSSICPIVYNVLERMKMVTGFVPDTQKHKALD